MPPKEGKALTDRENEEKTRLRSPELTAEEFARVVAQRTSRVSFAVAFVG